MAKIKKEQKSNKTKKPKLDRKWHLVNAESQVLGRMATRVAILLRGKEKTEFVPNYDLGDFVVITNASKIYVSGKKFEQKTYYRHSGYIGGLKEVKLGKLFKEKPEEVIKSAISGMLPRNKLKKFWLKRLYIFPKAEHKFEDKFKNHHKEQ